ncbi:KTSC domain-containing protein [Yersinia enterocolitica]|uniref:KTSC domain-containing protein n=1 Tax=Yersinia enterocolitica TaxID=630 RepID=UPI001C8DB31B|nr:KTSC domain-containing protein [Yersinia enterocolitica]EKN3343205.1 KTSC domain-containing protein [Yersinia enterocolitica]MBX9495177.1 KTSC domain-containing protein [Yersinia enterocolitica]HDL7146622.1 KTSC domain-containing protein [Yersinia enterocolitica]HDL7206739.1 KTSC domain-containing protein [Yersinia enterocolitica]HDL7370194.1 KTSC domain-containing protein [Yersinia enterocolitica]
MNRQPVVSSNIRSIGYDANDSTLEIEFNNGAIYQYFDIPQNIYSDLIHSDSVGGYLARHIKGHFRFSRV